MAWCWFVTRIHDVQVIPPWQSLVTHIINIVYLSMQMCLLFRLSTLPPVRLLSGWAATGVPSSTSQIRGRPSRILPPPKHGCTPSQALSKSHALLLQDYGCVERTAESDRARVPLTVMGLLPSSRPSVGSRNPAPMPSPLTPPQLCTLFQRTHQECQGAEASADLLWPGWFPPPLYIPPLYFWGMETIDTSHFVHVDSDCSAVPVWAVVTSPTHRILNQ